ncbi:MAG: hypothetical protein ACLQOO_16985 [Terriglobia bacterium]
MKTRVGLLRQPRLAGVLVVALAAGASLVSVCAQEEKHKVPGLDKVVSEASHQMFSGKIQSVDFKRELLNVNAVSGTETEFFPLKKTVHVADPNGVKLSLAALVPGADILVHYDVKGDRRTIKDIVVLAPPAAKDEKKKAPSS